MTTEKKDKRFREIFHEEFFRPELIKAAQSRIKTLADYWPLVDNCVIYATKKRLRGEGLI